MTLEQDTDLIATLRSKLQSVERERDELRGAMQATLDGVPETLHVADRRASEFWFALCRERNRQRAMVEVEVAGLKRELSDLGRDLRAARSLIAELEAS